MDEKLIAAIIIIDAALNELVDENQKYIQNAIILLERNIIDLYEKQEGEGLKKAVQYHKELEKEFIKTYESAVRKQVAGYGAVEKLVEQKFKSLDIPIAWTAADKATFNAIRQSAIDNFMTVADTAKEKLIQSTYDHILVGTSKTAFLDDVRNSLTGYSQSGVPMAAYAEQKAHDMLMGYHARVELKKAKDAGLDSFLYYGNIIKDSRPFCIERVMKVFTRKTINSWDKLTWQGKKPGPTMINRGGYRCRHSFHAVKPEWVQTAKVTESRA